MPISTHIVCINGFQQARYGDTGLGRLARRLHELYASPLCRVSTHAWDDDFKGIAARIYHDSQPLANEEITIHIVAYSWGVGHGALALCRELDLQGMDVDTLSCCDGVFHNWRRPWLALLHPAWVRAWNRWAVFGPHWLQRLLLYPTIRIPGNVAQVQIYRQQNNRPMGAEILPSYLTTRLINHGLDPSRRHAAMDNSPEFHAQAIRACGGGLS